jgi:hypothetical protein
LAPAETQRLQRARAQFVRIALAPAGDFDDPPGDDFPHQSGLPDVVKAMAYAIERFAHRSGRVVIERPTSKKTE